MNRATDKRRKLVVVALVVLFSAPLLAALVMRLTGWTPGATGNHGELIQPPVELPPLEASAAEDHWLLVFNPARPCEQPCLDVFDSLLRVQRALGRDAHRLTLVAAPGVEQGAAGVLWLDDPQWLDTLDAQVTGGLQANAAYLVDPNNFYVMRYPPGFQADGLLDDLDRLLRYSKVGVQ